MSGLIKVKQLKSGNEPYGKPLITDGNGGFTYDSGLTSTAISNTIIQPWADINRCGFVDNEQTSLLFNDSTYVFTLSGLTTWSYYRRGIKYNISGNRTVTLPSTAETYYITIDSTDGTLQYSTSVWTLKDYTLPVAVVRLNINNTPKYHLSDERHTNAIDRRLHLYLHQTRGTQFVEGGILDGPTLNTATDAGVTFGISQTTIADEDLYEDLLPLVRPSGTTLAYNIYYRYNSSGWTWSPSEVPFLYSPTYITWDNDGVMSTGSTSNFYNTYLLYTNQNATARYSIVHGRGQYNSLIAAQAESPLSFDWTGFPVDESVIAYQYTWATSNSYTNKGKCRLEGSKLINITTIKTVSSSGGIDHNSSSGLQGGLPNERYHLSETDYSITVAMSSVVSSEISNRISADSSLVTALSSEISSTNSEVTSLSSTISSEISSRTTGDSSLSTAISTRISVDSSLSTSLNTEISQRISADASILAAIPSSNLSGLTEQYNTFLGYNAGLNNSNDYNTFVGYMTGYNNITGYNNTYIGDRAGWNNNGSNNTYLGNNTGANNTNGTQDVIIGSHAGYGLEYSSSNVIIGTLSAQLSLTGISNVYIGTLCGYSNNGSKNVFIGHQSGRSGYTNLDNSVFIGTYSGIKETQSNTLIIDSLERISEIEGRNKALIYGKFDTSLANQFLRINGKFFVSGLTSGTTSNSVYYDSTTNEFLYGIISGGDSYWQKSGTSVYIIDDNISVGTSTASHKFTIGGTQSKSGSFENLFSINSNDAANQLRLKFGLNNSATATSRGATIQAVEESVEYRNLLLNPDGGNVGIGTTTINHKLDVRGEVGFYNSGIHGTLGNAIYLGSSSYPTIYRNLIKSSVSYNPELSTLIFALSNGESTQNDVLTLKGNGNVGVNGIPAKNFDVFGYSRISHTSPELELFNTTNGDIWGTIQGVAGTGSGGGIAIWTKRNGDTQSEKLRILDNGNVGFGTTAPKYKVEIRNTTASDTIQDLLTLNPLVVSNGDEGSRIRFASGQAAWTGDAGWITAQRVGTTQQSRLDFSIRNTYNVNPATVLSIVGDGGTNGNVGIGATAPIAKLQVNGLIAAYRYSSAPNLPAITIDKPSSYAYGIGPDGTYMRIRYGATTGMDGAAWVDNGGIEHYFDGNINLTGKLYLNGITNISKSNMLFYDTTTKEISYSTNLYITEFVTLTSSSNITVDCSVSNNHILTTSLAAFTLKLTNTVNGQNGNIILDLGTLSTAVTISNTPTAYKSGTFTGLGVGKYVIEWCAYSSYIFYKITRYS